MTSRFGDALDTLDSTVPEELREFLRDTGVAWLEAREITARPWKASKRAFHVRLVDGRAAKARLLLDGRSAEDIASLLGEGAASRRCARIIHGRGRCLLEEWVDGELLRGSTTAQEVLVECGRALADIHRTPVTRDGIVSAEPASAIDRVRNDLLALRSAGCLTDSEAAALMGVLEAATPAPGLQGLVHLDYCLDNIILHADRGPVCIDNETVRIGPFALDIARTITRCPLDGDSRERFLAGYVAAGGPADLQDLDFWCLAADAWSARLRLEYGNTAIEPQLAALRRRIEARPLSTEGSPRMRSGRVSPSGSSGL